ncbi:hypothetical protein KEM55_001011 [Ascosphaera atra]|nr:hypothetical protein KEM55_001011 [Ascosphaera atra]
MLPSDNELKHSTNALQDLLVQRKLVSREDLTRRAAGVGGERNEKKSNKRTPLGEAFSYVPNRVEKERERKARKRGFVVERDDGNAGKRSCAQVSQDHDQDQDADADVEMTGMNVENDLRSTQTRSQAGAPASPRSSSRKRPSTPQRNRRRQHLSPSQHSTPASQTTLTHLIAHLFIPWGVSSPEIHAAQARGGLDFTPGTTSPPTVPVSVKKPPFELATELDPEFDPSAVKVWDALVNTEAEEIAGVKGQREGSGVLASPGLGVGIGKVEEHGDFAFRDVVDEGDDVFGFGGRDEAGSAGAAARMLISACLLFSTEREPEDVI